MRLPDRRAQVVAGAVCVVLGLIVLLVALGGVPAQDANPRVPVPVVYLGGVALTAAGGLLLVTPPSLVTHFCAFTFYVSFAAIFWWIALAAPSDMFERNSILLSDETDVLVARVLFGAVATLASVILLYALTTLARKSTFLGGSKN